MKSLSVHRRSGGCFTSSDLFYCTAASAIRLAFTMAKSYISCICRAGGWSFRRSRFIHAVDDRYPPENHAPAWPGNLVDGAWKQYRLARFACVVCATGSGLLEISIQLSFFGMLSLVQRFLILALVGLLLVGPSLYLYVLCAGYQYRYPGIAART